VATLDSFWCAKHLHNHDFVDRHQVSPVM